MSDEKLVQLKKRVWDPISSAVVLCFCCVCFVLIQHFHGAYTWHAGGLQDVADQWSKQPVIDMKWVNAGQACPTGWESVTSKARYGKRQLSRGVKPALQTHKGLCLLRGGLKADMDDDPEDQVPRPKTGCAAKKPPLKVCQTGKFPYCGKTGVKCPLVDAYDVMLGSTTFGMLHTCNTTIPGAYLPWSGCRPIVDVELSSTRPCFKYDTNSWLIKRHRDEHCLEGDKRYRLMKVFPFVDAKGRLHQSSSSGVYFRHEIYFNPKCTEGQERFAIGAEMLVIMRKVLLAALMLSIVQAAFVGFLFPLSGMIKPLKGLHLVSKQVVYDPIVGFAILLRVGLIVLMGCFCLNTALHLRRYFSPLAIDASCIDPYLRSVVLEFLLAIKHFILFGFLMCGVVSLQILLDFLMTPPREWLEDQDPAEAAPLFQPPPDMSPEEKAKRNNTRYVYSSQPVDLKAAVQARANEPMPTFGQNRR